MAPVSKIASDRKRYIDQPYPNGESYMDVVRRVAQFLVDLERDWPRCRVLAVGHSATRWALDYLLNGVSLEELVDAPFDWRTGWDYEVPADWSGLSRPAGQL